MEEEIFEYWGRAEIFLKIFCVLTLSVSTWKIHYNNNIKLYRRTKANNRTKDSEYQRWQQKKVSFTGARFHFAVAVVYCGERTLLIICRNLNITLWCKKWLLCAAFGGYISQFFSVIQHTAVAAILCEKSERIELMQKGVLIM